MRYLNALVTTEDDDPDCDTAFIAGYESAGGTWSGEITTRDHADVSLPSIGDEFDILTTNGTYLASNGVYAIDPLRHYQKGCLSVHPAGSNNFHAHTYTSDFFGSAIPAGNGAYGNMGGYLAEMIAPDPIYKDCSIEYIIPSGTFEYDIVSLTRLTPTVEHHRIIKLRINRTAVNEAFFGGDYGHGMPFRISTAITGTDITPLPSGTIYAYDSERGSSYIDLYFEPETLTTGTVGLAQGVTTGKIKLKTSDTNILIKTNRELEGQSFYVIAGWGLHLRGITGFSSNPSGAYEAKWFLPTLDGWYDKVEVEHTTGSGSYTGGGVLKVDTQSYSTPYLAGQLAYIKDRLEALRGEPVSWWEVRMRARITATPAPDAYSTFGLVNPREAINYRGFIIDDPFIQLGEVGQISIRKTGTDLYMLTASLVTNATEYELYKDGVLQGDIAFVNLGHNPAIEISQPPTFPSKNHNSYCYKAYNATREQQTEFSAGVKVHNYKYRGIFVKNKRT